MLTAGVLLFDASGRIRTSLPPAAHFNGGTPTVGGGFLAVEPTTEPEVWLGGLGYKISGNICETDSVIDPIGVMANARGQVRAGGDPPAYWYAGLPFTAEGLLSIVPPIAPADFAFGNGFSNAFDSPNAP